MLQGGSTQEYVNKSTNSWGGGRLAHQALLPEASHRKNKLLNISNESPSRKMRYQEPAEAETLTENRSMERMYPTYAKCSR